jgi:hydrogenase maturation factor
MSCGADHCITCGDDGTEMCVAEVDAGAGLAWCTGPMGRELVEVSLLEPVMPGDRILVHAGTAIASLGGVR